jgi:hypothetical protein
MHWIFRHSKSGGFAHNQPEKKHRGQADLVDLYRMVVANMEFLDNVFSSKRLESTLATRNIWTILCWIASDLVKLELKLVTGTIYLYVIVHTYTYI